MNIFKQFYKSIYSPRDIALFRFQGIGKTILYVFFLTFISILPSVIYISTALSSGIDSAKTIIKNEAPDFSIKNGVLSAETKVPVTIDKDDFTIMIDPTGVISDADVENEGNAFALLKNEFVLSSGGRIDTYPYSMLEGLDITKNDFLNFTDKISGMKGIIIPVVSVLIYLLSSASSFIEISILALFGLALKNLLGRKLNYRQLWRMAAYSETLPTVFFTIMAAMKTSVSNSFVINWIVAIIVLALAINEMPKPKKKAN
ncbi:DUF1189 domain-containing protein [Neobacillus sp. MM2021_6]|uniref:DUF1189 domain-containing protein n=1 Tax=Bacillaceae TaxID=186817 RepID=UPI00140A89DD|nr:MULTISPECIES: DUF1189 domain-containing protein [Bacillaceae]MBO0959486.1 DUF1189 domain-containing protein [Neobacillus sp. MM2021_6]NHC17216.1 DUF1189 domain-containing protein [Bacillus sp. MM2020_4]